MCNRPSFLTLWMLLLASIVIGSPVRAQQNARGPDALILLQPEGAGLQVSVTYPNAVPHTAARERLAKLARAMRWTLQSIQVKDEKIVSHPDFGPQKVLGTQTGAGAHIPEGAYSRNGGFILQPFIETFSDLKRFEVFFFVPPIKGFQGLREFDSPSVFIKLIREGGPYRYYVEMRNPGARIPAIPLTQVVSNQAVPPVQDRRPAAPAPADFAPVVVLAAASALGVFFLLMLRAKYRAAQVGKAREAPASRVTIVRRDR
jgi:hypothetical protein